MEYRNLNRVFGFNKGLRGYNERACCRLGRMDVWVLLGVYHLTDYRGCSVFELRDYLKGYYRTYPPDMLLRMLKRYLSEGLVYKERSHYSLTLYGKNCLSDIEKRCRTIRYDR